MGEIHKRYLDRRRVIACVEAEQLVSQCVNCILLLCGKLSAAAEIRLSAA